jgi:zinc/manganese transport system ATP-binding protein
METLLEYRAVERGDPPDAGRCGGRADLAGAVGRPVSDAIKLRDVTLGYDGHPAVHHLTGAFATGSLTAIVGPNGSGKSTLLKGIMGQLVPLGGRIEREGKMAYLPQSAEIDKSFPATVSELVAFGLWQERGAFRAITRSDRERMAAALHAVGLDGFAARPIDTLSGGQMQRALFARVILQNAPVVLLDEPFAAIDDRTVGDLMHLVAHWHEEGRTVLAVLHDIELVRRHFPQTLLLAREPVAWGTTAVTLRPENLQRARAMPEAWDERAPWHDQNHHGEHVH